MANLHLLQRRRRDGSLALRGHSPTEDPVFPEEFDFGFAQIGEGTYPAKIEGDTIKVEYVNARATYKVVGPLRQPNGNRGEDGHTERPEQGFHAVLDAGSVEFFDAPEVTEESIAAYQSTLSAKDEEVKPGESLAQPGTPTVDDKQVDPFTGGNA